MITAPDAIPLSALFAKVHATDVQVSPRGQFIAWQARSDGVMNLWLAPLPLSSPPALDPSDSSSGGSSIPGARQLTAVTDGRDVCFCYRFTCDDKRIVFLRETQQGKEFYHLYCLDNISSIEEPRTNFRDLFEDFPQVTCSVGFVGGLQLWLPPNRPNIVILSTGKGSLFWDLTAVDIDSGHISVLFANPASTKTGIAKLAVHWLIYVAAYSLCRAVLFLTLSLVKLPYLRCVSAPSAPLQYFVDNSGNMIGCAECALSPGISMQFTICDESGKRIPVGSSIPLDELSMQLVGSGGATGTLRMERRAETVAVHTCNTHDTTTFVEYPGQKVIARHSTADISGFICSPSTGIAQAVIVETDHQEIIAIGQQGIILKEALSIIRNKLSCSHDSIVSVYSRSLQDDIWIVRVSSSLSPGQYFIIYDPFSTSPRSSLLLVSRPKLLRYDLASTESIVIETRDGLNLPGYLTLPRDSKRSAHLPMVIILHGGPSARDYSCYNPLVQLLAARGIAVMSVNYRGSTGFGKKFLQKGNGALQEMHNDVEDSRLWAISCGIAHPSKIAILGASWGGYLALGGATGLFAPLHGANDALDHHRYAAVVAIVPPVVVGKANTTTAFRGDPLVARYWRQIYGSKVSEDMEASKAVSPLYHLDKLRGSRLLLIHGEDDPRVPLQHGDCIMKAAVENEVPGGYVTYAKEGHSIRREPNVLHLWQTVEYFLCKSFNMNCSQKPAEIGDHTATVHWKTANMILDPSAGAEEF